VLPSVNAPDTLRVPCTETARATFKVLDAVKVLDVVRGPTLRAAATRAVDPKEAESETDKVVCRDTAASTLRVPNPLRASVTLRVAPRDTSLVTLNVPAMDV